MTTPDKEAMPTAGRLTVSPNDGANILNERGDVVVMCFNPDDDGGEDYSENLAAQIVTACNAYEPMREALNALRVDRDYWNADARRLSAGLLAIHRADESVPASVLRGIAYDISLNCIPQDVAEFQIEERSRVALSTLPVNDRHHSGNAWIVGNGSGTEWRYWTDFGPAWTPDREKATRYARREDAEAVHAADEDAWTVEPYVSSAEFPRNSESNRHHLGSDNERMFENVRDAWKIVWEREAQIAQLSAALQGYIDNCTNEECEHCIKARAALKGVPQPASSPIGYLYLNPDTGAEFSENHPVASGECDDAVDVREATAEALRDELLEAWREREDAEVELAKKEAAMIGAQIKHMVDRFLMWKLPEHFNPDDGISFDPVASKGTPYEFRRSPSGTNLFSAEQATAMVRHMLEGLPKPASEAGKLSTDTLGEA